MPAADGTLKNQVVLTVRHQGVPLAAMQEQVSEPGELVACLVRDWGSGLRSPCLAFFCACGM